MCNCFSLQPSAFIHESIHQRGLSQAPNLPHLLPDSRFLLEAVVGMIFSQWLRILAMITPVILCPKPKSCGVHNASCNFPPFYNPTACLLEQAQPLQPLIELSYLIGSLCESHFWGLPEKHVDLANKFQLRSHFTILTSSIFMLFCFCNFLFAMLSILSQYARCC